MRCINVNNVSFEVTDEKAAKLISSGAIYECGPEYGHDLHLNPEHQFSLVEVETLLTMSE